MTSRGALGYAHARIRAAKSRLLTREDAAPLFTATDAAGMRRVLAALGIEHPLARLVRTYETALAGYRDRAPLIRALLAQYEIENVKLLWRELQTRNQKPETRDLWLDLGPLATVSRVSAASAHEFAEHLAATPYASIARDVARAHAADLTAGELAFDRWVSQRMLGEARSLPREEAMARRLIESVVRERDAELVRRGAKWYGLASVSGTAPDVLALRHERFRLCRRAFIGSPFRLAPMIAVLLLAGAEVRAVGALVERQGDDTLDAAAMRAIAGSQIGP